MADYLLLLHMRSQENASKRSWRLKDVNNPFDLNERQFQGKYRLSKPATYYLIQELRPHVQVSYQGYALEVQVLVFLRIMASGSFQNVIAEGMFAQISQASVSRFVKRITDAMLLLANRHITFPTDPDQLQETITRFYSKFGFPNVCGVIDGTHINIFRPNCRDWFSYLDREGNFSINVQMVCDSNMQILDVVARWPGGTHDAFIWNFSGLKVLMDNLRRTCYLIGDNGYPLQMCLMTPYLNPVTPPENLFNTKLKKTRNIVERCFGVLKSRFRILDDSGGTLLYSPERTCYMVIAAAILHNICIRFNLEIPEVILRNRNDDDDYDYVQRYGGNTQQARQLRDDIAQRFQAAR